MAGKKSAKTKLVSKGGGSTKNQGVAKASNKKAPIMMPVPGLPGSEPGHFAFTAELDDLYARGWPYLRVLSDETVSPALAQRKALAALQAIDPYLPTVVPRDVARRMLLGYRFHGFKQVDAIKAAITTDKAIDESLLRESIKVKFSQLGGANETYEFRMVETVLLYEAFLGTETVARALVEHCLAAMRDVKLWGDTRFDIDDSNANPHRVLEALGWLRLRLPASTWSDMVRPLREGNPKLPDYSSSLLALADDGAPVNRVYFELPFAIQRRDRQATLSALEERDWAWGDAAAMYLVGADYLLSCSLSDLKSKPKWEQERLVAEMGTIRAPGTVRVMGALLASRSVGTLAASWLHSRATWVTDEVLPVLESLGKDKHLVDSVRALLRGEALAPAKSPVVLRKEKAAVFTELPAAMKACNDDLDRERAAMKSAFDRYCEIQAALGEVSPDEGFTHRLDLKWGVDKERVRRWIDIAVDL